MECQGRSVSACFGAVLFSTLNFIVQSQVLSVEVIETFREREDGMGTGAYPFSVSLETLVINSFDKKASFAYGLLMARSQDILALFKVGQIMGGDWKSDHLLPHPIIENPSQLSPSFYHFPTSRSHDLQQLNIL